MSRCASLVVLSQACCVREPALLDRREMLVPQCALLHSFYSLHKVLRHFLLTLSYAHRSQQRLQGVVWVVCPLQYFFPHFHFESARRAVAGQLHSDVLQARQLIHRRETPRPNSRNVSPPLVR
jgi:hypothetical protein